ncbi:MAG: transcription antitermination factor NusB [Acidobacteriaceae bacterium]
METKISLSRSVAFEILLKVATTDAHSDELLRGREVDALEARDRGLATTLVLGTLRWRMKLDARIQALLARPSAKLPPAVETALRLGAFQLLYLDRVPAHAAIDESVELTKQAGETFASGMVNAVLRKLARSRRAAAEPVLLDSGSGQIAEEFAHPGWMVERWERFYGREIARGICAFDQEPVEICVRLAHPDAERALAEEGVELGAGEFLTAARRVVRGDVVRSEAFRRGWVRIQDEGSQLVAELAGRGANILDTCAAPGGKTAILAERNADATILAVDVSRRRLNLMRRNFAEGRIRFAVEDAAEAQFKPDYDLILCDVPCTGTGTMGRNPEIRFRVNEKEIVRQHDRQVRILSRALEGLAPGGRLLYSTCSLEPEENEAVVSECSRRGFEIVSLDEDVARLEHEGMIHAQGAARLRESALRDGFLRTVPGVHGCDGFFAASYIRR